MCEQEMFRLGEPRYMTRGIAERLPVLYQMLLWNAIDNLKESGQKMDYLQVFTLETKENPDRVGKLLILRHSQEKPAYKQEYKFPVGIGAEDVNGKIFVIDDTEQATMLWAEEY